MYLFLFSILTSVTVCTINLTGAQLMYTSVDGTFVDAEAKCPPPSCVLFATALP